MARFVDYEEPVKTKTKNPGLTQAQIQSTKAALKGAYNGPVAPDFERIVIGANGEQVTSPNGKISVDETGAGASSAGANKQSKFVDYVEDSGVSPLGGDWKNFAAGIGAKVTDIPLGIKQRFHELQNYTSRGLPGSEIDAKRLDATNQEAADKRRLDAPLMATKAGKGGALVGAAIPAAAAALTPGGQGLAASLLAGGGLGAVEPTIADESLSKNTLFGLAGGGAGYGVGKLIGKAGQGIGDWASKNQTINALKDSILGQSKNMGYVIPPTQANSAGVRGFINKTTEGLAGKLSTAQKASVKNQPITNQVIAKDLGLPDDQPISIEALKGVRAQAGKAYDEVKQLGTIAADKKYFSDLDEIASSTRSAAKSFPGLKNSKLEEIVESLKQTKFDAGDAIEAIKGLRDEVSGFFARGEKTVGRAYAGAVDALENMIERAAEKSGKPELLNNFLAARTKIAKTYSVEKVLNDSTGNVSAKKLATQLASGKPLSGEIKKVAQFGQAFPKAAEEIQSSIPGSSPLDWAMGAGASVGTGNVAGMGMLAARPAARSLLLSRPYQKFMTTPSYESMLARALQNRITQQGLRIGTMVGLPQFTKE